MRWALAISLLAIACQGAPRSERDREVVTFKSRDSGARGAITDGELRAELARLRFEREASSLEAGPLPAELKDGAIERLIERRILLLEARRLGVKTSTSESSRELDRVTEELGARELERQLLGTLQTRDDLARALDERRVVGRLMSEVAHSGVEVTPAELEAAWGGLSEQERTRPARVRASQIVVVTEEEGKQAMDELKTAPFAEVALRHSIGPEAARGGDLGWIVPEEMPEVFRGLLSLEPGKLSPLLSSDYGFHIFKVAERAPAAPLSFEDAKQDLAATLLRAKLERAEAEYVARVTSRYKIERNKRALARIE